MREMTYGDILKNYPEQKIDGNLPFGEFKKNIYSQCGEDGVIIEIINRLKNINKFYVEFGAWDGVNLSNTANLRINQKWNGILFEADECKVNSVKLSNLYCEKISSQNINQIFKKYNIPFDFGLLSIDIDGNDSYCWDGLSKEYKPIIVIIEFNPGLPNSCPIRIKENESNVEFGYFGANINCIYNIGVEKGYRFVTITGWNIIFVREEIFHNLNIPEIDKSKIIKIFTNGDGYKEWRSRMEIRTDLWIINDNLFKGN